MVLLLLMPHREQRTESTMNAGSEGAAKITQVSLGRRVRDWYKNSTL